MMEMDGCRTMPIARGYGNTETESSNGTIKVLEQKKFLTVYNYTLTTYFV